MIIQMQSLGALLRVLGAVPMLGGALRRAQKRWKPGCRLCQHLIAGLALISAKAEAGQILYVTNAIDNTVAEVDDKGKVTTFIGAKAGLKSPTGIALDGSGNIYVANYDAGKEKGWIEKFDKTGKDLGVFAATGLKIPEDILFSKAGDLYVANTGDNTIHEFSATGKDEGVFANVGLNHPHGLAFDAAGRLYVANEGDGRVHLFSPSGKDRGVFVKAGIMKTPLDLAFDSAGVLYATDNLNHLVDKFDKNGKLLGALGGRGSLFHPLGLVFDPAGNLFVSNYGGNTIRQFDKNGKDDGTFARGLQGPEFMVTTSAPEPSSIVILGLGMIAVFGYATFWRGSRKWSGTRIILRTKAAMAGTDP
jgi:DNA-binding beta-propeller fold protein YncE